MVTIEEQSANVTAARQQLEEQRGLVKSKREEALDAQRRLEEAKAKLPEATQARLRGKGIFAGLKGRQRRIAVEQAREDISGKEALAGEYLGELGKYEQEQLVPFEEQISQAETQISEAATKQAAWNTALSYFQNNIAPSQVVDSPLVQSYLQSIYKDYSATKEAFANEISNLQTQMGPNEKLIVDWKNMRIKGVDSGTFGQSMTVEGYNKKIDELNKQFQTPSYDLQDITKDLGRTEKTKEFPSLTGMAAAPKSHDLFPLVSAASNETFLTTGSPIEYAPMTPVPANMKPGYVEINPATGKPFGTVEPAPSFLKSLTGFFGREISQKGPVTGLISATSQLAAGQVQKVLDIGPGGSYQAGVNLQPAFEIAPYFTPVGPELLVAGGAERLLFPQGKAERQAIKQSLIKYNVPKTGAAILSYAPAALELGLGAYGVKTKIEPYVVSTPEYIKIGKPETQTQFFGTVTQYPKYSRLDVLGKNYHGPRITNEELLSYEGPKATYFGGEGINIPKGKFSAELGKGTIFLGDVRAGYRFEPKLLSLTPPGVPEVRVQVPEMVPYKTIGYGQALGKGYAVKESPFFETSFGKIKVYLRAGLGRGQISRTKVYLPGEEPVSDVSAMIFRRRGNVYTGVGGQPKMRIQKTTGEISYVIRRPSIKGKLSIAKSKVQEIPSDIEVYLGGSKKSSPEFFKKLYEQPETVQVQKPKLSKVEKKATGSFVSASETAAVSRMKILQAERTHVGRLPSMVGGQSLGLEQTPFYGQGIYERTDFGLGLGMTGRAVQNFDMGIKTNERLKMFTIPKQRQYLAQREEQKMLPLSLSRMVLIPKERGRLRYAEVSPVLVRERQKQRQRLKQNQIQTLELIPAFPRPRPPRMPGIRPRFKGKSKEQYTSTFSQIREQVIPVIKRRGRYMPFGGPTTYTSAVTRGIAGLRATLGASLQIWGVKTGKRYPVGKLTPEFRPGQRGKDVFTLVQRAPKRLKSRQEVAEITLARKGGIKWF